jgi:hypothetical protein
VPHSSQSPRDEWGTSTQTEPIKLTQEKAMFTLFFLAPIILAIVAVRIVFRFLGFGHHHRRRYMGYGPGYNGYGCRHRSGFGGGLFSILALVALDRITRRW